MAPPEAEEDVVFSITESKQIHRTENLNVTFIIYYEPQVIFFFRIGQKGGTCKQLCANICTAGTADQWVHVTGGFDSTSPH